MKKKIYLMCTAFLCILLSVATIGGTYAKYIGSFEGVSFDFSAKGSRYSITYNANGGNFEDGNDIKTTTKIGDNSFDLSSCVPINPYVSLKGWDTNPSATNVIYKHNDTVNITLPSLIQLYAVWEVESNLSADNQIFNIDSKGHDISFGVNGVVSHFERVFFNLGALDPDYVYKIEFKYTVSGKYQTAARGGYGWQVIGQSAKSEASNLEKPTEDLTGCPRGTLKPLIDYTAKDDEIIGEENVERSGTFIPDGGNMYLYLELSNFEDDNFPSYHYLDSIKVTRIGGKIHNNFKNSDASISTNMPDNNGNYSFTLNAKNGTHERIAIVLPETFEKEQKYKVQFTYGGPTNYMNGYSYNFTVSNDISCLSDKGQNDIVSTWDGFLEKNTTKTYEYEFTATSEKMYLLFHLAELADGNSHQINLSDITVTKVTE